MGSTKKEKLVIQPFSLAHDEKKEIAYTCELLQMMAFPMNRNTVSMVIQSYLAKLTRTNPFTTNGIPGEAWWKGFLQRWPSLTERRLSSIPAEKQGRSSKC